MSLVINIYYTGKNGSAKKFAEEMVTSGIVDRVRNEEGNERYEYFFPMDEMMKEISDLRNKYELKMRVEKFKEYEEK